MRNLAAAMQRSARAPSVRRPGIRDRARARSTTSSHELAELSPAERRRVPGIKPARGDIVLAGAIVIQAVLEAGGFAAIEATEAGLREGDLLRAPARRARRGAADRGPPARERAEPGRPVRHDARPHAPTSHGSRCRLFELQLAAAGLHAGDAEGARAAARPLTLLHDIGVAIDDHHHHKPLRAPGSSAPGLPGLHVSVRSSLIGQTVRYHRKGNSRQLGPVQRR